MKKLILILLFPQLSSAVTKITCDVVERYNDQRLEYQFKIETADQNALMNYTSKRDPNIRFVAYYSKDQSVVGARIIDDGLGTQSGNYIDPKTEKADVKVRYIKSKPEVQLFAIDCTVK